MNHLRIAAFVLLYVYAAFEFSKYLHILRLAG